MGGFILKVILRLWLVCAFMVPLSTVRAENLLTHVIDGQIFADHSAVMLVIEPRTGDIVFANESLMKEIFV